MSVWPHPISFRRRALNEVGILPIAELAGRLEDERALVAGLVISAQRPPTARGTAYITLEDETGRVQALVPPHLADGIRLVLAESHVIAISGRIERSGGHITLLSRAMRVVPAVIHPRRAAKRRRTASSRTVA